MVIGQEILIVIPKNKRNKESKFMAAIMMVKGSENSEDNGDG